MTRTHRVRTDVEQDQPRAEDRLAKPLGKLGTRADALVVPDVDALIPEPQDFRVDDLLRHRARSTRKRTARPLRRLEKACPINVPLGEAMGVALAPSVILPQKRNNLSLRNSVDVRWYVVVTELVVRFRPRPPFQISQLGKTRWLELTPKSLHVPTLTRY